MGLKIEKQFHHHVRQFPGYLECGSNLAKVAAALNVEVIELFRYSSIDLGETSKQKDLQEIIDLLIKHSKEDIRKAKVILKEIFG
jgi:hypothetical protein